MKAKIAYILAGLGFVVLLGGLVYFDPVHLIEGLAVWWIAYVMLKK